MTKHVLSVQDLSCVGRCSLTVTLPVLSAMGIRCSALPTAVLSTHTAFPKPEVVSLTEQLTPFAAHWKENGIAFDAISIGYLSDPEQGEAVKAILAMQENDPLVILDPVMGDNGKLYSRITDAHLRSMRALSKQADILLPNITEAAGLTGLPYRADWDDGYLSELLAGLLELCPSAVITGVRREDGQIGVYGGSRGQAPFCWQDELVPRSFHGTGDLFSAVCAGHLVQGKALPFAASRAGMFVKACVEATPSVTPHGVEFEKMLPLLFAAAPADI